MKNNDCVCYFERQSADDYKFTVGGVTYYVDAKAKEGNYFITFAAIEELEMERKKDAILKKIRSRRKLLKF